ncbi:MAG TPA: alpha/beta fold hydrolase [Acidimicrobiales bacterium]|nr:alpha/beta fold hydrolase [Acidimicrobiales bacterium]
MTPTSFRVADPDGLRTVVHEWPSPAAPRAVVHVLHGWAEHALRYDRVATHLGRSGFAVCADDHRGHGATGTESGTLGDLGPRGMAGVLDAVKAAGDAIRGRYPGVPCFLLGHSWGSFLAQRYVRRWPHDLAGLLLTGTTLRRAGAGAGGALNARFEPARTAYDWLSRDVDEVDRYVADPLCGFEMMRPASTTERSAPDDVADDAIPTDLPVYVFNGADDPIGGDAGGRALADHYRGLGLTDVTFRSYDGGRHELFNEINRDEVERDVLAWLDAHTGA